jgi:hypothetical protein
MGSVLAITCGIGFVLLGVRGELCESVLGDVLHIQFERNQRLLPWWRRRTYEGYVKRIRALFLLFGLASVAAGLVMAAKAVAG